MIELKRSGSRFINPACNKTKRLITSCFETLLSSFPLRSESEDFLPDGSICQAQNAGIESVPALSTQIDREVCRSEVTISVFANAGEFQEMSISRSEYARIVSPPDKCIQK